MIVTDNIAVPAAVNVDFLIDEMWERCMSMPDADSVDIRARHDQWWGVTAECVHGKWVGFSRGAVDLSTGFVSLHKRFMDEHPLP